MHFAAPTAEGLARPGAPGARLAPPHSEHLLLGGRVPLGGPAAPGAGAAAAVCASAEMQTIVGRCEPPISCPGWRLSLLCLST